MIYLTRNDFIEKRLNPNSKLFSNPTHPAQDIISTPHPSIRTSYIKEYIKGGSEKSGILVTFFLFNFELIFFF